MKQFRIVYIFKNRTGSSVVVSASNRLEAYKEFSKKGISNIYNVWCEEINNVLE